MKKLLIIVFFASFILTFGYSKDVLRIFTWSGYVSPMDIKNVNKILYEKGYDIEVKVIDTFAEGPEQMFEIIRDEQCDISFLTLNYIKMQDEKMTKLLQVINTKSERLYNYDKLRKELKSINMGMSKEGPLYIPWGGGAYGIWANMKKLNKSDLPKSVKDLWDKKWKGKISLTKGQIQPNIALVMLALDKPLLIFQIKRQKKKLCYFIPN